MTTQRLDISSEKGFALVYVAVTLVVLLLFTGLAVDSGRAYIVKAQLTKAVDGAALGAARMLNSGNPKDEATKIFKQNFAAGYMATPAGEDPTAASNFFQLQTINATGVNVVTVTASVTMPTTFMKLANLNQVTVSSSGQATRRMVDISLVLDVSSSIGSRWIAVRDAARMFVDTFDANSDRMALVTFGNGARVVDAMPSSRGFNKAKLRGDIPNTLPGGSTNMVEGLYRGWDEVKSVPRGSQSGLRVVVLFTDGASNSVPGFYDGTGIAKALRTWDFPDNGADPDNQTHTNPEINGLYDTETGNPTPGYPAIAVLAPVARNNYVLPQGVTLAAVTSMPARSAHTHGRSSGIPRDFPLFTGALNVNGVAQQNVRPLRNYNASTNKYRAEAFNINNAARNLVEIIADAARSDTGGDYPIRIYAIGMGELVQYDLGTREETSESILKRMANDKTSADFNNAQLEGKYYFARTESDVSSAFQALQNQIIRLTK